jgi:hypothetical protein
VTVRYPTLEDYLHTAAYILDLPVETVIKAARIELAESALHAPQAGWGEIEFYPAALATTMAFCVVNGYDWIPPAGDDPDGEETFHRMRAIAAATAEDLEAVEAEVAGWIADRLRPAPPMVD